MGSKVAPRTKITLCAVTQTSHYYVLIVAIRSLSLEKSKQVTGHVFAETTRVVTEPHDGFASVVILATQLCMLCDVEICSEVLKPQGVESSHFHYFGFYISRDRMAMMMIMIMIMMKQITSYYYGWLGSRVVSVMASGAEDLGSNRSRDAVG